MRLVIAAVVSAAFYYIWSIPCFCLAFCKELRRVASAWHFFLVLQRTYSHQLRTFPEAMLIFASKRPAAPAFSQRNRLAQLVLLVLLF
jgi:hypothetical protein